MYGNVDSPPTALRLHHDVFLSFRGDDTRHSIIQNLFDSLQDHGIRVFKDDIGMNIGDEIAPSLMEAIEDSAASIIILSPRYADSHWCLEELSRICNLQRLILPVFYNVDPSQVKKQKGPFENDFRAHVERFGKNKVDQWRKAMAKVGGFSGFVFNGSDEQALIQLLVKRILKELERTVGLSTYTVGLNSRLEELMKLLNDKSSDVQVLGLNGMGGIGKTTLARALYNRLIQHFKYRCFISSVKEIAEEEDGGLVSLQNKFLHELSHNRAVSVTVSEVVDGVKEIKRMLEDKRVLAVLDDVNDMSQLTALAGNGDWFGEGSIVIITSRNEDIFVDHIVNKRYEVRELLPAQALQLFSYHAMGRGKITGDFLNIAKQIVSLTGHLPLALEVFASSLYHTRVKKEWEDAFKKLQSSQPQCLQNILRISFDGLHEEEKHVFLDIACLFVKIGMKKEEAIDILKGCGFRAETAINVLKAKSLIKISEDNTLWMHDQLRDMGRDIVRDQNLSDPGKRSRLWDQEEIMTVLKDNKISHFLMENKQGTKKVEGIILDFRKKMFWEDSSADAIFCSYFLTAPSLNSVLSYLKRKWTSLLCLPDGSDQEDMPTIRTKSFESMDNLRLLQINRCKLDGKFKFLAARLRWLQWKECPLKNLPSDYHPSQLSILDLSESGIERVWCWGSSKVADKLMVLNLHHCHKLVAIPNLYGYISLEKLNLEHCIQLSKIHKSVGNLRTLLHLNLKECSNLVELPSEVSGLKHLQTFILSGCKKLEALPDDIGNMKSLKELLVDQTAIIKLPESIYRLTKLEKLSLNRCRFIKQLPKAVGNLCSLKELSLDETALEELPHSIGSLSNLEKLSMIWCAFLATIPDSVAKLQSLSAIYVDNSAIKELPNSISSLSYLKQLSVGGCSSLSKLPDSIGGMSSISELVLDGTSITFLPKQIGALKMIEKLSMIKCALTTLPETIGSMFGLTHLNLFGAKIVELPETFGMLENLIILNLNECNQLQKLPASVGDLKSLQYLLMEKTAISELPESFGLLSSLMVLKMRKKPIRSLGTQEKSVVLPTSFSNLSRLQELDAHAWRISGKIRDDFEKLAMLETLDFGYNNFCNLPKSLKGLSLLKQLYLPHCKKLKHLPPLPSGLKELDAPNCIALESISDISNLVRLKLLNLTNCEKLVEIPGLEHSKSLVRLYMANCKSCSLSVKRRLSKVCLRNLENLSIPGSKMPDWFSQRVVTYAEQKNCEIKAVMICAVVCVDHRIPDDLRDELPCLPAFKIKLYNLNGLAICDNTPVLLGVPTSDEDQIHICRFHDYHPLVSRLRNGYKLEVTASGIIQGVQLKECGIFMVSENDDEYEGNEESLDENQLSLSAKLANFFNSIEENGQLV